MHLVKNTILNLFGLFCLNRYQILYSIIVTSFMRLNTRKFPGISLYLRLLKREVFMTWFTHCRQRKRPRKVPRNRMLPRLCLEKDHPQRSISISTDGAFCIPRTPPGGRAVAYGLHSYALVGTDPWSGVAVSLVADTVTCSCCLRHPYRVMPRGL